MTVENGNETVGQRCYFTVGDCSNSVALWDFAQRQGEKKYRILRQKYSRMDDQEIMEKNALTPEVYNTLL